MNYFDKVYSNPHLKDKMATQYKIENCLTEAEICFKTYKDYKANAEWGIEELAEQADYAILSLKTIIDELCDVINNC